MSVDDTGADATTCRWTRHSSGRSGKCREHRASLVVTESILRPLAPEGLLQMRK